mmetsp:Transcript_37852/g.45718  ORF Transcript_37852/g.45718 Transcript_37852/m.45718 type:complete len:207 (+) Transcript_37852:64-684(+)
MDNRQMTRQGKTPFQAARRLMNTEISGINRYERHFLERCRELKAFKRKFGDCHVPKNMKASSLNTNTDKISSNEYDFCSLGRWVKEQRVLYRTNKEHEGGCPLHVKNEHGIDRPPSCALTSPTTTLTEERTQILEEIGLEWESKLKFTSNKGRVWLTKFRELCQFHERYGHTLVRKNGSVGDDSEYRYGNDNSVNIKYKELGVWVS